MLSIVLLACLVNLHDWSPGADIFDVMSVSASMVAALGLGILCFLEQDGPARPSDLAVLYLLASVGCDLALLTMPARAYTSTRTSIPVVVRLSINTALLVSNSSGRRSVRSNSTPGKSPEESNGVLSRVFFTWINPILLKGYRRILTLEDLPPLRSDMRPERTRETILSTWGQRGMGSYLAEVLLVSQR